MKRINYKKQYFYQQDKKKEIYIDNLLIDQNSLLLHKN